jgi:hypothetical protein
MRYQGARIGVKIKHVPRARLSKPWITDELMRLCNIKHDLFRRYKVGEIDFLIYNRFKNKFTTSIKRNKCAYFRNKFEKCKDDIRAT